LNFGESAGKKTAAEGSYLHESAGDFASRDFSLTIVAG
jgi:hypothetical protein